MPTDIEQPKNDFLLYLNFLVFPSLETLIEKIHPLQETKLREIQFQSNSERKLSIINKKDKNSPVITLTEKELGIYGLSQKDFKKSIKAIKNNDKNSEKLLFQAIKEVIDLHNIKLCKIYISSTILTYTELYEKFRLENPNADKNGIQYLIDEIIENSLDKPKLIYNYFKRAYQGYENSTCFASIFGNETENHKLIFNITKELKLNFTLYQDSYISLINLIETLYIFTEDKEAANSLIKELKDHTDRFFSILIQKSSKNPNEKNDIKNFKLTVEELIKNYIENHPGECKKQQSILDCLLWFITKIIPESIFSKSKRMTLFGKYTETGIKIKNLTNQIIEKNIKSCL